MQGRLQEKATTVFSHPSPRAVERASGAPAEQQLAYRDMENRSALLYKEAISISGSNGTCR
jgi:hypothetical protein